MRQIEQPIAMQNTQSMINSWNLAMVVLSLLVVIPVISILAMSFFPKENIWPHLIDTVLPRYIINSLLLMLGVSIGVLLIGVSTAWFVTLYNFPAKKLFEWLLIVPIAMPAYVIAYAYTDLLEFSGPVQQFLRELFGWVSARDYWFPNIRTLSGAIFVMSLVLYPYVYITARAGFLELSPSMLESSRVLGRSQVYTFFKVALPLARPSIVLGLTLALMETLNDFGTVDYFAVQTFTTGVFDIWLNMGNLGGAAQISTVALTFVMLLVWLERISRRQQRYIQQGHHRFERLPIIQLYGKKKWLVTLLCLLPVIFGFLVPASLLFYYSVVYFSESWTAQFRALFINSISLALIAALIATFFAVILTYSRWMSLHWFNRFVVRLTSMGYALPGAILALGVLIPLASLDRWLDRLSEQLFDYNLGLLFSGTVFAILLAYVIRFLAVAFGSVESSMTKITPTMDMAARSLGYSARETLVKFHLPLLKSGIIAALLLVFVDCMKELPATLILRPFNFDTLATHVYQYASDEQLEHSALGALVIVLSGLIPIIFLNRFLTQSRHLPSK